MASASWIDWLSQSFPADEWLYSDQSSAFDWPCPPKNQQIQWRTEDMVQNPFWLDRLAGKTHCLVISHHPGLKHTGDVIQSGIVQLLKPTLIVFDPGLPREFFSDELHPELFERIGYPLLEIQELPKLAHHIAVFQRNSPPS